jgi:hypothetical protein
MPEEYRTIISSVHFSGYQRSHRKVAQILKMPLEEFELKYNEAVQMLQDFNQHLI